MNPSKADRSKLHQLTDLPNIGKESAKDLRLLGYTHPLEIQGACPIAMYDRLCQLTGQRHDPCVLDVFASITSFLDGEAARPWWEFTPVRGNLRPRNR